MFSSDEHWYKVNLPGCYTNMGWGEDYENYMWWAGDYDQRPDWSDMKTRYGSSKFSMTWINTKEITEFDDLFGHAKNLGLNGVWVYGYTDHGIPVRIMMMNGIILVMPHGIKDF